MRTPDERFANLPGYAYAPHYLYRRMIPPFEIIRNRPEPYVHAEGGHFLQEWGGDIAAQALASWC